MPAYTQEQRNYWMSAFACGPPATPPAEARFTITSGINGQGYWYNRMTGETPSGSVDAAADLDLTGHGTIVRVGTNGGNLLFNKSGGSSFTAWRTANPGWTMTITLATGNPLTFDDSNVASSGGSFLRITITAAQLTQLDNISTGDLIAVVIQV